MQSTRGSLLLFCCFISCWDLQAQTETNNNNICVWEGGRPVPSNFPHPHSCSDLPPHPRRPSLVPSDGGWVGLLRPHLHPRFFPPPPSAPPSPPPPPASPPPSLAAPPPRCRVSHGMHSVRWGARWVRTPRLNFAAFVWQVCVCVCPYLGPHHPYVRGRSHRRRSPHAR